MSISDSIRTSRLDVAMVLWLFVAAQSLFAQDAIIVDRVDASQWPTLQFRLRLLTAGTDTILPDPGRLVFFEENLPLTYSMRCDAPAPTPLALALGLELSLDSYFPQARDAALRALALVRCTDAADRVSLWTFASSIGHDLPLTHDSGRVASLILGKSEAQWPFNGTMLFETMYRAVEEAGAASETNKAVLFVTDGVNNTIYSNRDAADVINRAVGLGVRVHSIGIRQVAAGLAELRSIAAATGGIYHRVTDAGVFDSLARALRASIIPEHWCDIETQSRFCANGAVRRMFCRYITEQGDTLSTSVSYVSPLLPGELDTLALWSSPPRMMLTANDTAVVVLGVSLNNGVQPPSFTLALPLQGMRIVSALPVQWQATTRTSGDTLYLDATPPASGLTAGDYSVLRVTLTASSAISRDLQPTFQTQASSCIFATPGTVNRAVLIALDTMRTERGATADMPIRIYDSGLPEGVQDVVFRVSIDTAYARFNAAAPWTDEPGWQGSWALIDAGTLVMRLDRLTTDGTVPAGRAGITTLYTSPLHIPVAIDLSVVNAFGTPPQFRSEAGLIVLSDSCHPGIVMLSGLSISPPRPNPANYEVLLDVDVLGDTSIRLQLLDAGGKPVNERTMEMRKGLSTVRLGVSSLPSGSYSILCQSVYGITVQPLRIIR
ncbi:MAG: VWA domain-containing protein [Bacteroidia bacterium]|nr:VWA domain-containing protein [Bacteroidia bacterium]